MAIPEPREEEHVLQVHGDLGLPAQVEEEGEGVDVERAADDDGEEGADDESCVEPVVGEGEDGDADVGEDEVLGHEVELVEEVARDGARLGTEVVVRVVRLADSAEEDGHDARQVEDLADEEGRVRHDDEERRLQLGVIPA